MTKWVNTSGWLKRYASDNNVIIEKKEEPVVEKKEEVNFGNAVIFIRPRCPICKSTKVRCYGINVNIRYFRCACGHKFKGIEK